MKVRCIDTQCWEHLSIGTTYDVIDEKSHTYVIINDAGFNNSYGKKCFIVVDENINQTDTSKELISMILSDDNKEKYEQIPLPGMEGMVDNGQRMSFSTGAIREPHDGKGRYDLIPQEAIHRLAIWYEKGAKKYADRNWEKGIPTSNCMNSLLRHAFKASAGWQDEDHLAAIMWNAAAIIFMQANHKELDDMPRKEVK